MIVHLVPGTVLEARYTAYLNANRKDLVRKKKRKMWDGWGPGMNERDRKEQRHDSGPQREVNR